MRNLMRQNVEQRDGVRAYVDTQKVLDEVHRSNDAGDFCHVRGITYGSGYIPVCLDCAWKGTRTSVMYEALAEGAGHEDDLGHMSVLLYPLFIIRTR